MPFNEMLCVINLKKEKKEKHTLLTEKENLSNEFQVTVRCIPCQVCAKSQRLRVLVPSEEDGMPRKLVVVISLDKSLEAGPGPREVCNQHT